MSSFTLLDFETTGLDPARSEIIEIGAVRVNRETLEPEEVFHTLVRPTDPIPSAVVHLTGITQEMVEEAPDLDDVIPGFLEFLGTHPIVAHHSAMEQGFLDVHVAPLAATGGLPAVEDSIELIAMVLPELPSYALDFLRKWGSIETDQAHRAQQDCEDVLTLLVRCRQLLREERPQIQKIVQRHLSPDWWWSWFFEGEVLEHQLTTPDWGDLRKFRQQDENRKVDWKKKIDPQIPLHLLEEGAGRGGFEFRESQGQMAQWVQEALNEGKRLAVEAPTGTGKSVAYLLPGVLAARATETPLVISTHSKSLQDQLLEKDVPRVAQLAQLSDLRVAKVKGQENYLCLRKLNEAAEDGVQRRSQAEAAGEEPDPIGEEDWAVAYLLALASTSSAVELDQVSRYLKTRFPALGTLVDQVHSHRQTTIGPKCPFYKQCHFFNSARIAHQSDVLIANHALVFQWPSQLPKIRNIVFDEAHHLEDQITRSFSMGLSEEEIFSQVDRLTRRRGSRRWGDAGQMMKRMAELDFPAPYHEVKHSEHLMVLAETIRSKLSQLNGIIPLAFSNAHRDQAYEVTLNLSLGKFPREKEILEAFHNLVMAVEDMRKYLQAAVDALEDSEKVDDLAGDLLKNYLERFQAFEGILRALLATDQTNHLRLVHWRFRDNTWRAQVSPIEVKDLSEPFFEDKRGIVLTSATLSAGTNPEFHLQRIGLKESGGLRQLPSPFHLEKQAQLFFPLDIDQPGTPSHLESLIDFTARTARLLGGRTLVLITSNARLRVAAEELRRLLEPAHIEVFDSLTDSRAAENFLKTPRALLVGSERYGEGLDIPGQALSCVIIEKINEAMTRGPLPEARRAKTRFGIFDYDFPLRMTWLKQRVGRLIRSPSDRGTIVVFDPRYGKWSPNSRAQVDQTLAPMKPQLAARESILQQIENF